MSRPPLPLYADITRELVPDDFFTEKAESRAPEIKRLSQRHHRLARLLAEGYTPGQAAVAAGISISRVSILQADPMFKELVAHYTRQADDQFITVVEKLSDIAGLAADEVIERLETRPEDMDEDTLMKLIALTADRTGLAPPRAGAANVQVNFNGLGARLEAAQQRLKDVTPKEIE